MTYKTLLNPKNYNNRIFSPFYAIKIVKTTTWPSPQKAKYTYYNDIYGDRSKPKVSYKYFPTYITSSRKGAHDWTYSYYNARYKAEKIYTTKYTSTTRNVWDSDNDTPYKITEFVYSYNKGVDKC